MMKFPKKKVLKCLWVMKDVYIGLLIPATHPLLIAEEVGICLLIPDTIPFIITEDMLVDVDLGHKRPATLPIIIG